MSFDLKRHAPPGIDLAAEQQVFLLGMIGALVWSGMFPVRYGQGWSDLWYWSGDVRVLRPDAVIAPFGQLMDNALLGFGILAAALVLLILRHYAYYRQGSRADYLMRRLPRRNLWHKQCLTLPLAGIAICMMTALLLLGIYALIYYRVTPAQCLPPNARMWGTTMIGGI